MTVPSQTDLAYIAGMIDGDGFITINRSSRNAAGEYFGPNIGITGTRREPHDFAASFWGGKVSMYQPANSEHRAQFQWSRMGRRAVPIIEAIYPFLRVKKEQAELALMLAEHLDFARDIDPFPWFGPDYDPLIEMRRMRDEMINLNQSRKRIGKKKSGRILDGHTWDEFPKVSA